MARRVVPGVAASVPPSWAWARGLADVAQATRTADPTAGPIARDHAAGSVPTTLPGNPDQRINHARDDALAKAGLPLGKAAEPTAWKGTGRGASLETAAGTRTVAPSTGGDWRAAAAHLLDRRRPPHPCFVGQEPTAEMRPRPSCPSRWVNPTAHGDDGAADEVREPPPDARGGPPIDDDDPVPTLTYLAPRRRGRLVGERAGRTGDRASPSALRSPPGIFSSTFEADHEEIHSWLTEPIFATGRSRRRGRGVPGYGARRGVGPPPGVPGPRARSSGRGRPPVGLACRSPPPRSSPWFRRRRGGRGATHRCRGKIDAGPRAGRAGSIAVTFEHEGTVPLRVVQSGFGGVRQDGGRHVLDPRRAHLRRPSTSASRAAYRAARMAPWPTLGGWRVAAEPLGSARPLGRRRVGPSASVSRRTTSSSPCASSAASDRSSGAVLSGIVRQGD